MIDHRSYSHNLKFKLKFFDIIKNKPSEIHNSKIGNACDKNWWFYERAKLSYFTFKRSGDWNRIYCVVTLVCVFRFFYTFLLKRNSEVKKMSSDSESNSFANCWSRSDEDIMEDDEDDVEESSNTQTDVTRSVTWCFDRVIQMPFLRETEIAQLYALVKLTIFGSYALHTDLKSEANLVCQSVCQCVCHFEDEMTRDRSPRVQVVWVLVVSSCFVGHCLFSNREGLGTSL